MFEYILPKTAREGLGYRGVMRLVVRNFRLSLVWIVGAGRSRAKKIQRYISEILNLLTSKANSEILTLESSILSVLFMFFSCGGSKRHRG